MDITKTKLYKAIKSPTTSVSELWRMCSEFVNSKKNINISDNLTKETFLHVLVRHGGQLRTARGVGVIYLLASSVADVNARDSQGETCLHKAARVSGSYKIVEALMRCGVDPFITNNDQKTAEDILQAEQPLAWKQTLHWINKYKPGLYNALTQTTIDIKCVDRLLKGWCRTHQTKHDGTDVALSDILEINDDVRSLLQKYACTNEFVIAILSGKTPRIAGNTSEINVNTLDYMYETEDPDHANKTLEVPRPLLLVACETTNEHSVNILLSLDVDTTALYSISGNRMDAVPIFFHLLSHEDRLPDAIILKILLSTDTSVRDQNGRTVLFKAISADFSKQFIKTLLKYGVDIAARDRKGMTARDYSDMLKKTDYFAEIDDHVIEIVKKCHVDELQTLVLKSYGHILDITDSRGINAINIIKRSPATQNNAAMLKFIDKIRGIQQHLVLMFRATDTGNVDELRRFASKRFATAQDKCGRTILHKAILHKKHDMIKFIVHNYGTIIDYQDNLGRTALHYAYLVSENTSLANYLLLNGASPTITDWTRRLPEQYHIDSCGKDEYARLKMAVKSFTMDVYLAETNFEQSLKKAVKKEDLASVEELVLGLTDKSDINRYANLLFYCVDTGRQRIAVYLIQRGMRTDIYKQYENCNSLSSACLRYTCDHTITSLYARAKQQNCQDVVKAIQASFPSNKKFFSVEGRVFEAGPSSMDQFSLLGLL